MEFVSNFENNDLNCRCNGEKEKLRCCNLPKEILLSTRGAGTGAGGEGWGAIFETTECSSYRIRSLRFGSGLISFRVSLMVFNDFNVRPPRNRSKQQIRSRLFEFYVFIVIIMKAAIARGWTQYFWYLVIWFCARLTATFWLWPTSIS